MSRHLKKQLISSYKLCAESDWSVIMCMQSEMCVDAFADVSEVEAEAIKRNKFVYND